MSWTGNASILIVDDHDALRCVLRDWLAARYPGITAVEARDGEEALRRIATESFDIVLMDISMPGMNGFEATHRLRESHPETRVVVVSAHDGAAQRSAAAAAGACAFVGKRRMYHGLRAALDPIMPARR